MNFERGKEVKDALDLGLKKDAIKIHKITYTIDDTIREITNPAKMRLFLRKLAEGTLPKDPILGIEKISLISIEKTISEDHKYESGGFGSTGRSRIEYSIAEYPQEKPLSDMFGKVISIYGKLQRMPTSDDLKKVGFGHLEEFEESWGDIGEDEEHQELNKELQKKMMEESFRQQKEWEEEFKRNNPEAYENANKKGKGDGEETQKKKRRWGKKKK